MEMGGWHKERMCESSEKSFLKICIMLILRNRLQSMCGLDGIQIGNYFGGEPIGRAEVEARVDKFKNGKVAGKDEITVEMIKGGGDRMVDLIWRLCNMTFESDVVPEDWRSSGPWLMLGICSLSVLVSYMKHYLCLFFRMAVRQCYGGRRRDLVRAVQMDKFRGLLGIRRMDRVLYTWIRELCRVKKGLDERIDE